MDNFSVTESFKRRSQPIDVVFIDVRTSAEFKSIHAEGSVNLPMQKLDLDEITFAKENEIHVICQSGGRSIKVCQKLETAGFTNVVNVEGGTSAWHEAGLPVVEGNKVMSIERQVRVATGSLVVIGALFGQFLHPAGFGLSAFIGAGLVFAGITDTCGMGMVIAKMPWNRA